MTTMKKLASVFFAVIMCFATFAFASCGKDKNENKTYTAYEFTLVYEDGNPAKGYFVQLCTIDESTGELGMCYNPAEADANGKVIYTLAPNAGVYEIHLLNASYQAVEFEGEKTTAATYGAYTLTIKK